MPAPFWKYDSWEARGWEVSGWIDAGENVLLSAGSDGGAEVALLCAGDCSGCEFCGGFAAAVGGELVFFLR